MQLQSLSFEQDKNDRVALWETRYNNITYTYSSFRVKFLAITRVNRSISEIYRLRMHPNPKKLHVNGLLWEAFMHSYLWFTTKYVLKFN